MFKCCIIDRKVWEDLILKSWFCSNIHLLHISVTSWKLLSDYFSISSEAVHFSAVCDINVLLCAIYFVQKSSLCRYFCILWLWGNFPYFSHRKRMDQKRGNKFCAVKDESQTGFMYSGVYYYLVTPYVQFNRTFTLQFLNWPADGDISSTKTHVLVFRPVYKLEQNGLV